ncbi:MAG: type II toxin-antitoxin system PemK/MazF family toxin [Jatrophihabitans sp.]|uniref:type II toxin-antitoxin system PemK/MazF family toxin n=1 Tax=Jatrophihabitans sp. TaxID=1932789 RepID=UPI003911BC8E
MAALPDHVGAIEFAYAPHPDGHADPGEIVWTWVPYEDDPSRGKDRPVLVLGFTDHYLLGVMLSSKDHDLDAEDEERHGRHWLDIGAGAWDSRHRPSEVRVDRILTLDPAEVRREGAQLDRAMFDDVVAAVRAARG